MKNKIKNILIIVLIIAVSTVTSVMANTLIDSKEVIYDNSKSGIKSTNVQAAVDELYSAATNYTDINKRVNNLEQYNTDLYNVKGLDISFTKIGRLVEVNIFGSMNENLNTSSEYVTLLNIPDKYIPLTNLNFFTMYNSKLYGAIVLNGNKLSYGYTYLSSNGERVDYTAGMGSYVHFTYISKY